MRFGYGDQPILDDLSLRIAPREIFGVIGPNGSGKSTLLRLLSGILAPDDGDVLLFGKLLQGYSRRDIARAVAVVPQETSIEFPYSVTEVVLMGRSPHFGGFAFEGDRDVEIAHAAMRRTAVDHLARRSIHELSGGERQRVILARALAQDAPILLLDEPAAFLDIRHEVEIYDLLRDLQAEGKSIVTVLHDLNLAALYCDRVGLLHNGRFLRLGPPDTVITYAAITEAYDIEVYVDRNDITGAVNVLPLSRRYRDALAARRNTRP